MFQTPTRTPGLRMLALLLFLVAFVGACKPKASNAPLSPSAVDAAIARLEREVERDPDDGDAWRELAHLRWLYKGQSDKASPILDRLAGEGDPIAALSRLVIAHGQLDFDVVKTQAMVVVRAAADDRPFEERALAIALAESAVRFLEDVHGTDPGDDDRFLTFFETVDLTRLPIEVTQPLLSLRASIERKRGGDYHRFYTEQGCVQDFAIGELEGHLGPGELARLERNPTPFVPDDEAKSSSLACVVRVWNPHPRPGVRRLSATLDVKQGPLVIDVAAGEVFRAYLDGKPVVSSDRTDRYPAKRSRMRVPVEPGPHSLEIRVAIPRDRAWVLARVTDGSGRPVAASPEPPTTSVQSADAAPAAKVQVLPWPESSLGLGGGSYAPLRLYLALDDALADVDSDRSESLAETLRALEGEGEPGPAFSEAYLLLADFENADPSRGRSASGTREEEALRRALALDPGSDRSRLRLLQRSLERGESQDVITELEELPDDQLGGLYGHLLRFDAYSAAGSELLAEQALTSAASVHPDHCEVLVAKRNLARNRSRTTQEDELIQRLAACPGTLALRARNARLRGKDEVARALYEEKLGRSPDDLDTMESLAALAITEGDYDKARGLYETVLEYAPYRTGTHIGLADLLAQTGKPDRARAQVQASLQLVPQNMRLREIGEKVGLADPLMAERADGDAAREAYQAGEVDYPGAPEVLVLDRDVAEIYPGGGQRHLIHQIVELRSKEALDRYGEFVPPPGASLLTLQTIKPDGTVLEPELVPGKDGASLRNLEIGDFVEMEYMLENDPNGMLPGYVDLTTFRFQDLQTPYHYSELVVLHPEGMKVQVENRNDAPKAERTVSNGRVRLRFLAERMKQRSPEPQARSMLDELPIVRVFTALEVEDWIGMIATSLAPSQRTNPQLRDKALELTEGLKSERDKIDAVHAWVMDNVEEGGDLGTPATVTMARKQGNRLMLIRAMLQTAGVATELWIARDRFGPRIYKDGHPMVEAYEAPMLASFPDGAQQPLMIVTTSEHMPLGYLVPSFSGAEAYRLTLADGDPAPGKVMLPKNPSRFADRRRYDLDVALDATGAGTVKGTIALQGAEAFQWRQALDQVDSDRIEEVFQQAELSVLLRGASLDVDSLEIENGDDPQQDLILRFTALARNVGAVQGGRLTFGAAVVPMNIGLGYASLAERWSGMVVPYAPVQEATVRITVKGADIKAPKPAQLDTAFGSYTRTVKGDGKTLTLETRGELELGEILADDYDDFTRYIQAVAAAEQALVTAK